ncbi:PLDc N-terminal domain-containing protein [Aestuariicella sp. G3-2]|uniref:PLDc N-terminal domain-containing protein n=1 Tax=Pseudomaricurvus albidus TaxID=2842452 RepID=UPI001C0BBBEF|nr:PLDc N-terminal domain-containing protein [Aestuariicella albida]MBU3071327.1 PLDc N-terminal domain-containing protein [Aestuariicella albida]
MDFQISGILGLLILIADVWAIINIAQSSASMVEKLIWILVVLLLPVLGLLIWFFAGPRGRGA